MTLFNKPKWLKPEVNEAKYWVHILVLAYIVKTIGKLEIGVFLLGSYISIADIIAHTILKLD